MHWLEAFLVIPHSKLAFKFLSSNPRQKEITRYSRQHSFENVFLPTAERGGKDYDMLYQNSLRKYEDDLEHVFYVSYDLQFFQIKCDGFTVL